jgi:hypothetical protein
LTFALCSSGGAIVRSVVDDEHPTRNQAVMIVKTILISLLRLMRTDNALSAVISADTGATSG